MRNSTINSLLNKIDSPLLLQNDKTANILSFIEPVFSRAIPGVGRAIQSAGGYVGGLGKRLLQPGIERFQQGMQRAVQSMPADAGAYGKYIRPYMAGATEFAAGSIPGRALAALGSSNSKLWRSPIGFAFGSNPMMGVFKSLAMLEGARQGKEVGGWGGAIAGGAAGLGGSAIGWRAADMLRRGIFRDLQHQMLAGKYTALRARPGVIRNQIGKGIGAATRGVENLLGMPGKFSGPGTRMGKIQNFFSRSYNNAMKNSVNVVTPSGATVALPRSGSQFLHGSTELPAISGLITVPLATGMTMAAVGGATGLTNSMFDKYKRMSGTMHDNNQIRLARENYLRKLSPEFNATGYNPYASYGG